MGPKGERACHRWHRGFARKQEIRVEFSKTKKNTYGKCELTGRSNTAVFPCSGDVCLHLLAAFRFAVRNMYIHTTEGFQHAPTFKGQSRTGRAAWWDEKGEKRVPEFRVFVYEERGELVSGFVTNFLHDLTVQNSTGSFSSLFSSSFPFLSPSVRTDKQQCILRAY